MSKRVSAAAGAAAIAGAAIAFAVTTPAQADDRMICTGISTFKGTYVFDFEERCRQLTGGEGLGDVWWHQIDGKRREMAQHAGGVGLAVIGKRSSAQWRALTRADLAKLKFSDRPINASDGANRLPDGTVFAVRTRSGHFAKVRVDSHKFDNNLRRDLRISHVTFA